MERPQLPSQQKRKLEWVTPKISLMEAGDTDGSGKPSRFQYEDPNIKLRRYGPS